MRESDNNPMIEYVIRSLQSFISRARARRDQGARTADTMGKIGEVTNG